MSINFNSLPTDRAASLKENGFYKAKITRAEMKTPTNGGTPYLALTYDLTDMHNKPAGKFWDNFFDVEKELPRYKLGRLINATKLKLTGNFELRDLAKILPGKEMIADIGVDKKADPPKNCVNVFDHEIYYPIESWAMLVDPNATPFDLPETAESADDAPINAADAASTEY